MAESEFLSMFADQVRAAVERMRDALRICVEQFAAEGVVHPDVVTAIYRDIHNVNAEAGLVDFAAMAELTALTNRLLDDLRSAVRPVVEDDLDVLTEAIDAVDQLGQSAAAGTTSTAAPSELLDELRGVAHRRDAPPEPQQQDVRELPDLPNELRIAVPDEYLAAVVGLARETRTLRLRLGESLVLKGIDPATIPDFRGMERILADLEEVVMEARAVPLQFLEQSLYRLVRETARATGKRVAWASSGEELEVEMGILEPLALALTELIVNAVDHGIEKPAERKRIGKSPEGRLTLRAWRDGAQTYITLADDGRGIPVDQLRARAAASGMDVTSVNDDDITQLIFKNGMSTASERSRLSGSGTGMDQVRASLDELRGRIVVTAPPAGGTEFTLIIPSSLSVVSALTVQAGRHVLGIPMYAVDGVLPRDAPRSLVGGRPMVSESGRITPVDSLASMVGEPASWDGPVIVLATGSRRHGFVVDAVMGRHDIAVKALPRVIPRTTVLGGVAVQSDGGLLLTVDARSVIDRARSSGLSGPVTVESSAATVSRRRRILVVDDSLAVRELQRAMLERAGFDAELCDSGGAALARLDTVHIDLVLADVEMPGMNGYDLVRAIRGHRQHRNLPVVMVTSYASDEQRRHGLEAGADGYVDKQNFSENALIEGIERLLGEGR